jgi:hypothetical protein
MSLTKLPPRVMVAALLGLAACTGTQTLGSASPGQAADSTATGSTTAPINCKASTDANGVPCKICVDNTGTVAYDDCTAGASGTGGSGGTGGTTAGDVKCVPTTDATTGAACKTCYAADGSYTSYCSAPPQTGSGGAGGSGTTIVKCAATTDPSTGAACKTCYAADGSVASNDCSGGAGGSGGTTVMCVPTTDPTTGAACKTCYAADGSVASNACSGGAGGSSGTAVKCSSSTDLNGLACQTCYAADGSISSNSCTPPSGGASCVGATNIETGQVCKVCSDTTTGKLVFVDCPIPACVSPSTTTAPPPTK